MAGVEDKTEDKGRPAPMGRGGHKRRDTGLPAREDGPRGTPPGRARGSRAEKPRRPTPDSFRPGTPRFDREELKRLPTLAHCDRTKELRRDAPFLGAARRRPLHGPGRFRVRRGREGGPGGDGAAAPTERSTRTAPAAPSPSEGSGRRGTRRAPPRRFAATAAVPTAFGARSGRSPRRAAALASKDPRPPPFAHHVLGGRFRSPDGSYPIWRSRNFAGHAPAEGALFRSRAQIARERPLPPPRALPPAAVRPAETSRALPAAPRERK